jgi:hypothetical protein
MKRTIINILLLFTSFLFILSSCKKDEFTEKDALEAQQLFDLIVRVYDGATLEKEGVSGAQVKTTDKDGEVLSANTNADGIVTFNDVNIGDNSVVIIKKDGYTAVSTDIGYAPSNFREKQKTVNVPIYSTSDSTKVAIIKGKLTIETDVTNRKKEVVPEGTLVKVSRYNNDDNVNAYDYSFIGTTDAQGMYSIYVPVSAEGQDNLYITYPVIQTKQTAAVFENSNTKLNYSVQQIDKVFGFTGNTDALDVVPSIHVSVAAPTTVGSGLSFSTSPKPSTLSYSSLELVYGGQYDSTGWRYFSFSADPDGDIDSIGAYIDPGSKTITSVFLATSNGEYTQAPTLDLTGNGMQTQAIVDLEFEIQYYIMLENGGSNYKTWPNITAEGSRYVSNVIENEQDNDATDGIYFDGDWLDNLKLANGTFYPTWNRGDTIYETGALATSLPPSMTVINNDPKRVYVSANNIGIAVDSTLSSISMYNGEDGIGYDGTSPPAVTITTLAGYGSEAVIKATVDDDSSLEGLIIMNPGHGYVNNVNDYDGDGINETAVSRYSGAVSNAFSDTRYIYDAKPGSLYRVDLYYGTGEDVESENY